MACPAKKGAAVAGTACGERLGAEVVGTVFYGTLLKTMRASNLKGQYGHGGRGEEVFQAQLDQTLADQAGQAASFNLADIYPGDSVLVPRKLVEIHWIKETKDITQILFQMAVVVGVLAAI